MPVRARHIFYTACSYFCPPGRTRFERLLFIGRSCKPLCVDALRAAVDEAKEGKDVLRYKEAWDSLRQAAPDDPRAVRDENWIETVEATNQTETNTLEGELRQYRNNLIKESIRVRLCIL